MIGTQVAIRRAVIAYEKGRREIVAATKIDEVVVIKDKAEQLRKYAMQRKDAVLEACASAIALRAHHRIGEISKGLEKGAGPGRGKTSPTDGTSFKRAALKAAGISKSSAERAEYLTTILSKAEVEKLCERAVEESTPAPSANAFYLQDKDNRRKTEFEKIKDKLPPGVHVGDFRVLSPKVISDNSVELVFIDPPYDDASIPLYEAAAHEAARVLKPGGSLISYCGHLQLPRVLPLMSVHLKYYWIGAHVHDGGPMSRMVQFGIIAGFKPLLWFVKEFRADRQHYLADTVLVKREKNIHAWQQAEATAEHFIAELTSPTGLIVDFFAGGGTTAAVAKRLGRKWVTFEIDETAVAGIVRRVS